jgi:hypothetical protein
MGLIIKKLRQPDLDSREPLFVGRSPWFFNKRLTKKVNINNENATDTELTANNTW